MSSNIHYLLIFPQMAIVVITWIQTIFSLNRFRSIVSFTPPELVGFLLFLISGTNKWVAALSTKKNSFSFQLFSSLIGTLLFTSGFVIIYNNNFSLASKQQWFGIFLSAIVTVCWELQGRILIDY